MRIPPETDELFESVGASIRRTERRITLINGIINIYKEKGYTSHDVVAKLRGILKQKKIGHTGTLDPDATGVLPVCLGSGTKLCDLLTDKDKTYEAVLKLGISTDTQDMTGSILKEQEVSLSLKNIEEAVLSFTGEYRQIPPMYSAIKVNGKRLYELARDGIEIERKARTVTIHNITIEEIKENEVRMIVSCSKGTYIRTLCHDIGEKLGCGGCMKSLIRTKSGIFTIEDSLKLCEVKELLDTGEFDSHIIKVEDMFLEYSKVLVAKEYTKFIYNGNKISSGMLMDYTSDNITKKVRVYDYLNQFIGLYEVTEDEKIYKPVKMFLS